jgi:DNA polymerase epsilon subunit 1
MGAVTQAGGRADGSGGPQDVDLCRDENVVQQDGRWLCPLCHNEYNKAALEEKLVEILRRRSAAFQLQDLRCGKCRRVKIDNMTEYCKCSGRYEPTESSSDLDTLCATEPAPAAACRRLTGGRARRTRTLGNIAEYYDMPLLLEMTGWIAAV